MKRKLNKRMSLWLFTLLGLLSISGGGTAYGVDEHMIQPEDEAVAPTPNDSSSVLTPQPRVSGFDWTIFDEPGELDGAVEVTKNTAVKVDTSGLVGDKAPKRDYYMVFNGVSNKDNNKLAFEQGTAGTTSTLLKDTGLNFPSIVGAKGPADALVGYSYYYQAGGNWGSGFDIGTLGSTDRLEKRSKFSSINTSSNEVGTMSKLMTNKAKNEIFAYGYITLGTLEVPVRISGKSINNKGRVRFTLKYQNPFGVTTDFATSYGVHMDIQGKHKRTKMYSLGNDEGLYFKQPADLPLERLLDGENYFLYFYRNNYVGQSNPPTAFFGNDAALGSINSYFGTTEALYSAIPTPDVAKDAQYPFTSHPGWLYLYPKTTLKPNEIGTSDLEMSVTEQKARAVTYNYVDDTGETLDTVTDTLFEGDTYNPLDFKKDFTGYKYDRVVDSGNGVVGNTPITLTFHYIKARTVTMNYVDESNKVIGTKQTETFFPGDTYTAATYKKEIAGYKYDRVDDPGKGVVGKSDLTLTFYYKTARTATINYLDDKNQVIETKKETLYVGDSYNVETYKKEITGYTFVRVDPASGTVGAEDLTLNLYYKANMVGSQTITFDDVTAGTTGVTTTEIGHELQVNIKTNYTVEVKGWENITLTAPIPKGFVFKPGSFMEGKKSIPDDKLTIGTGTLSFNMGRFASTLAPGRYYKMHTYILVASKDAQQGVPIKWPATAEGTDLTVTSEGQLTVLNKQPITVTFKNDKGAELHAPIVTENYEVGSKVDLTKLPAVTTAVKSLTDKGYLVTRPANETALTVAEGGTTAAYTFTGTLSLTSVPKVLNFGTIRYNTKTQRVEDPSYVEPLVVRDTRSDKTDGWTMTAEVTTPMTNGDNKLLKNALRYVYKGKEQTLSSDAQVVYTATTSTIPESYSVSENWGTTKGSDGVKFQLDSSETAYIGEYTGVITWKIMPGQP
ncbi:MucBP domain-containing protein [Enterococcus rotai]|uniref:MucBP domain-containing protein n=1 Tax=Enterococcus rotai TaxID=118060 RepID=UPI0032B44E8A